MGNEISTSATTHEFFREQLVSRENDLVGDVDRVRDEFAKCLGVSCLAKESTYDRLIPYYVAGEGSYGKVWIASYARTGPKFAVKMISKAETLESENVDYVINEKNILYALRHQNICRLFHHFQNVDTLYLVMEMIQGSDLFLYLNRNGPFTEMDAKFYVAQICFVYEYLHTFSIAYRDLKPENIVLDAGGYVKVIDFCFSKIVNGRTYSLCGTPEYIAPEMILQQGYTYYVDWWQLGVLTYELLVGETPFTDNMPVNLCRKILSNPLTIPKKLSSEAADFITNLLNKNPGLRMGCNSKDACQVRKHSWFNGFNFLAVYDRQVTPPIIPSKVNMEWTAAPNTIINVENVKDPDFADF